MTINSTNQRIIFKGISLTVKREDQIHAQISGNKYRKLKYNVLEAKKQQLDTLLTFGGAYSNHIVATAAAGKEYGLKAIGIIRGEELRTKIDDNPTLSNARDHGMQLDFVTREQYRQKETSLFLKELHNKFGEFYVIPEGGTNALAIKGCQEILTEIDTEFDIICCPVGTGGTITGLINSASVHQKVLGFPALKGDFLTKEIRKYTSKNNWELILDYHFGGYGKIKPELITFINQFKDVTNIALDPIYTGKMLFGILDLYAKGYFKKTDKILVIHTGGLQGIVGMNMKLKQKGLPIITQ